MEMPFYAQMATLPAASGCWG